MTRYKNALIYLLIHVGDGGVNDTATTLEPQQIISGKLTSEWYSNQKSLLPRGPRRWQTWFVLALERLGPCRISLQVSFAESVTQKHTPDGGVVVWSELLDVATLLANHGASHLGGDQQTRLKLVSTPKSLRQVGLTIHLKLPVSMYILPVGLAHCHPYHRSLLALRSSCQWLDLQGRSINSSSGKLYQLSTKSHQSRIENLQCHIQL